MRFQPLRGWPPLRVSALRRPDTSAPSRPGFHMGEAASHDIIQRRHALEQRDVLEGAGRALLGDLIGLHRLRALHPDKRISPSCGW